LIEKIVWAYFIFSEQVNRRQYSKSESLLVSLLKQEAITEKKQDIQSNKISSIILTEPIVSIKREKKLDDNITIDSNNIQFKLDKKDTDFIIKKQKITKKTTNKNQVVLHFLNETS
jgi:hypothetical protein